ncbi:DUF3558 family protein [Saccharopolyspora pogona]|uniref:DUF3558 family protein n=1 Tax=Saccharopolyspora pogona TaxID=333966 RepID=UPI001CC25E00|nr:DUF3558 family protein [Saccharopolyspora pogona]
MAGAVVALAGCNSPSGKEAPSENAEPTKPSLASFDPCTALTPEKLQAQGLSAPGKPVDQGIGESGCEFDGSEFLLSVLKGEKSSLSYWEGRRANMGVFERNQVGSRQGIKMISAGSVGQGICSQVIEASSGSVSVQVTYSADKIQSDDATCAKAMEIAQVVEPKLPQ